MTVESEHRKSSALLAYLPALAFVATFGVFAVDKNREARTVLGSGRGLLTLFAIVVAYIVVARVVRRATKRAWTAPVALAAVVIGLAAWLVRPYYVDSTVNRRLIGGPVSESTGGPADHTGAGATSPSVASEPIIVASGPLVGIGHEARGTASLLRALDGSLVVRLEEFDIEGVPDPRVHLVRGVDVKQAGGIALGRLPGNRGEVLDIRVPPGSSAGPGWTVLIWCRAFSVPVANATLTSQVG